MVFKLHEISFKVSKTYDYDCIVLFKLIFSVITTTRKNVFIFP